MTRSLTLFAATLLLAVVVNTAAYASLLVVDGRITAIQGKGRTITLQAGEEKLILETDAATLVTISDTENTPAALRIGNTVRVKYALVHGKNMAAEILLVTD